MQLAGCYYAFTYYARNIGLCPHMKNPRFYRGVPFYNFLPIFLKIGLTSEKVAILDFGGA